MNGIT
jgi:hypothetical protein